MWIVYALLSALFAALTAVFSKAGVAHINSNLATFIRTAVVFIMLAVIVLSRGETKDISAISKQNLLWLIISGLATGLSWLFYFKALQTGKLSQVAPVDKLSIVFTVLLAVLFLGESISSKNIVAIALIVAGVLLFAFGK